MFSIFRVVYSQVLGSFWLILWIFTLTEKLNHPCSLCKNAKLGCMKGMSFFWMVDSFSFKSIFKAMTLLQVNPKFHKNDTRSVYLLDPQINFQFSISYAQINFQFCLGFWYVWTKIAIAQKVMDRETKFKMQAAQCQILQQTFF